MEDKMGRKLILLWGVLGLIFSAFFQSAAAREAASPKVRLGVCDWTLERSGDPRALELAAKLGLAGVQVSLNILDDSLLLASRSLQKTYLDVAKKRAVEIASFALGDLNNIPLQSDSRAEKWVRESIIVGQAMKVKIVLVPFFGKADLRNSPQGVDSIIEILKRLAPQAEKAGVILGLESWLSAEEDLKIIERVGSPAVQVYYDVANSQEAGYDIFREIRLLGKQICQVHAKDNKDLYGQGSIDFKAVRKALEDTGYSGWLIMEGTKMPLGVEQSISYDANYLKTIFPALKKR
jgi:sugar phosphate isomerase/epimerase